MAEAFVRTIKRDYVRVSPRPNAESVMRRLPSWIAHYNQVHPHKALGYRAPREFIAAHERLTVSGRSGGYYTFGLAAFGLVISLWRPKAKDVSCFPSRRSGLCS